MRPQARKQQILIQEVGDELVVYDQQRHRAHRLNRSSALIWRHCNGENTLSDLAKIVRKEMDLPAAEEVVRLGLERFRAARLLEETEKQADSPARISRRELISKLKTAGVFGLALPMITSIVTPAPVAAYFEPPPPASPPSSPPPAPSPPAKPTGRIFKPKDNPNQPAPPLPAAGDSIDGFTVCNGGCTDAPSLTGTVIGCKGTACDGAGCACHLFESEASTTGTWKRTQTSGFGPHPTDQTDYDPKKVYACICVK